MCQGMHEGPKHQNIHPSYHNSLPPSENRVLVGGFPTPFEKYARPIGSSPQVGVKIKNIWNHHPVCLSEEHKERPAKIKFCSSTGSPYQSVERFFSWKSLATIF